MWRGACAILHGGARAVCFPLHPLPGTPQQISPHSRNPNHFSWLATSKSHLLFLRSDISANVMRKAFDCIWNAMNNINLRQALRGIPFGLGALKVKMAWIVCHPLWDKVFFFCRGRWQQKTRCFCPFSFLSNYFLLSKENMVIWGVEKCFQDEFFSVFDFWWKEYDISKISFAF